MTLKLRTRLIVITLAVTLPIMIGAICFFAYLGSEARRNSIEDDMADTTNTTADAVARWDQYMIMALDNLKMQPDILSMDPQRQHEALRRMHEVYDRLDFIHITDINGRNTARSDERPLVNYEDRQWFRKTAHSQDVTREILLSRTTGHPAALMATPIFLNNKIIGVVAAGTDLTKLTDEIGNRTFGRTGRSFVIDEDGYIIAHPNAQYIQKMSHFPDHDPIRAVLHGKTGPFDYKNEEGVIHHAYAVRLSNGWSVISARALADINAEIFPIWLRAMIIIACAATALTAVLWYVAGKLVRPIDRLTQAANSLAQGHWDVRIPEDRHDEFGLLGNAFNRMTTELSQNYRNVEEKVAQRTQELAQSNSELQMARKSAEDANRAKDDFLTNVSHELRTPLTAVLGYTELMLDPTTAPDVPASSLRAIRSNATHLLQIVNDILDHSKINAGGMTVDPQPCSLQDLIREVTDCVVPRARAKSLKFDLQVDHMLPSHIVTDALRVKQSLINLLSNAIKFTDNGQVTLIIEPSTYSHKPMLNFVIKDTGVGIAPEYLPHLFRSFNQADSSRTRRFGGTGLGLAIAHGFAALLGGTIVAESKLGMGSTFIFSIPLMVPPQQAAKTQEAAPAAAQKQATSLAGALDGMKILLVEDGVDNQRLITMVLKKSGAAVELAENGSVALEMLEKQQYDAVLMDMQMPVMDGYTATRTLRTRGYTTPIIAVTAHAMAEDRAKCLASGCDDYMVKPIDRAKLINCIRDHLTQPHKEN